MKYIILMVVLCLFVPSFAQRAKVVIDTILITLDETGKGIELKQFDDGRLTPENCDLIGKGHFATGLVTTQCGEAVLIERTKEAAKKIGCDAYRFYDIVPPDMIMNTCYRAKILFLRMR